MAENERLSSAAAATAIAAAALLLSSLTSGVPDARTAVVRILATVVVWFWGEEVYGRPAALGATLLFSFHPLVLASAGGIVPVLLFAAVAHRALRLLLDPSLQDAAAIGAVAGVAAWITTAALGLVVFFVALSIARVATRNPHETMPRTVRACVSASVVCALVAVLSWSFLNAFAVPRAGLELAAPLGERVFPAAYSLAPLALIAIRPWRRHRRYADAGALAALLCLGAAAWWSEGVARAGAFAALPAAVVLAAAVWDHGSGLLRRGLGWALVTAQLVVAALAV